MGGGTTGQNKRRGPAVTAGLAGRGARVGSVFRPQPLAAPGQLIWNFRARSRWSTAGRWNLLPHLGRCQLLLMMIFYALEGRSHWYTLLFGCSRPAPYGWLAGTWPFGLIEVIWAASALHKWYGVGLG